MKRLVKIIITLVLIFSSIILITSCPAYPTSAAIEYVKDTFPLNFDTTGSNCTVINECIALDVVDDTGTHTIDNTGVVGLTQLEVVPLDAGIAGVEYKSVATWDTGAGTDNHGQGASEYFGTPYAGGANVLRFSLKNRVPGGRVQLEFADVVMGSIAGKTGIMFAIKVPGIRGGLGTTIIFHTTDDDEYATVRELSSGYTCDNWVYTIMDQLWVVYYVPFSEIYLDGIQGSEDLGYGITSNGKVVDNIKFQFRQDNSQTKFDYFSEYPAYLDAIQLY